MIAKMEGEPGLLTARLAGGEERLSEKNSRSSRAAGPNGWWKRFEAGALLERYNLVLATLHERSPLDPEFADELVEAMLNLQGELVGNGYVAEAVQLIYEFQSCLPEVYRKNYEYFDELLVTWHLFQNNPAGVKESLSRFMAVPVAGIDSLLPVLTKLCLFGFTDQALLLCEETFDAVSEAPNLIGDMEWELAHYMYLARLGRIYARYKQGAAIDWESLVRGMDRYGMEIDRELLARIQAGLTGGPLNGEQIIDAFVRQPEQELTNLAFGFFRYMYDEKGMDFPCSELIWRYTADFLSTRRHPAKGVDPNVYFRMTHAKLEPHLAEMIGGFLSRAQADAVAMLWGIPYIYDFLLERRVISEKTHRETIQIAATLKNEVIKGMGKRLWEFDFVHVWVPPDSVLKSEFEDEAAIFRRACAGDVPLAG